MPRDCGSVRETHAGGHGPPVARVAAGQRIDTPMRSPDWHSRTGGLGSFLAWAGRDRNYMVVTVRGGQIVAMRAFRNGDEARAFTGLPAAGR